MDRNLNSSHALAATITKAASKQTYYTIRLLVDRDRIADAYRAYGYFRWVDDVIDAEIPLLKDTDTRSDPGRVATSERIAFVNRQQSLLEACYRGETPEDLSAEEWILVDLVRNDNEKDSGLQSYLRNMMSVMRFDAARQNKVISQAELSGYSRVLAVAVTEAMYYFIGHERSPRHEARYLAVTAAHITHMLRDAFEDVDAGYFNIPREYLRSHGCSPKAVNSTAYREWVCSRVQLARAYFKAGRGCTAQVKNLRCRLAGFLYTARFEWMLRAVERDNYCLRPAYPERKSLRAGLWMIWRTLASLSTSAWTRMKPQSVALRHLQTKEL